MDEIFIRIFANMRIIRMNCIFPHPHGHPYSVKFNILRCLWSSRCKMIETQLSSPPQNGLKNKTLTPSHQSPQRCISHMIFDANNKVNPCFINTMQIQKYKYNPNVYINTKVSDGELHSSCPRQVFKQPFPSTNWESDVAIYEKSIINPFCMCNIHMTV